MKNHQITAQDEAKRSVRVMFLLLHLATDAVSCLNVHATLAEFWLLD